MGTSVGHIIPGVGYLILGLWQLCNHIKLHCCRHPNSYVNHPVWFPFPGRVKRLELYFIMSASLTYMCTELFVGPSQHHPLDPADWSIPTGHIHNFEHVTITLAMFIYAAFALRFDRVRPRVGHALSLLIAAHMFAAEFLVFYLHSTDHAGLEWQYHRLLLTIVAVSLITALMGVGYPRSFAVAFTRSVSVVFQGVWYIVLGVMLYTPRFIPKGCHLEEDEGFFMVPCGDHASLGRGKALVNLQFAWALDAVVVFSGWLYLRMAQKFPDQVTECECRPEEERCHVNWRVPVAGKGGEMKHEEVKVRGLLITRSGLNWKGKGGGSACPCMKCSRGGLFPHS